MKSKLALVAGIFFAATGAQAANYGMAGCGLGSMAFPNDGKIQILAATTNGFSGTQSFGITSGTSNCTHAGGTNKAEVEQEVFVSANYETLSQEMAQGSGEHLNAFAGLLGCDEAGKAAFGSMTQKNFRSLSASESPEALLQAVKSRVSQDSALASSCGV